MAHQVHRAPYGAFSKTTPARNPLHRAVLSADIMALHELLQAQHALDGTTVHQLPLGHDDGPQVLRLLASHGAPLNEAVRGGMTPLMAAIEHGDQALAVAFIELGADIQRENDAGATALHLACLHCPDIAVILMQRGAAANALMHDGTAPIHMLASSTASSEQRSAVLHLLAAAGAMLDTRDAEGRPATWIASAARDSSFLLALLQAGANPHTINRCGMPLLHWTVNSDEPQSVLVLLDAGASTLAKHGGRTAEQHAVAGAYWHAHAAFQSWRATRAASHMDHTTLMPL